MADSPVTVVWFRQDLRLADNPAILAAIERGQRTVMLYIHSTDEEGQWPPGGAMKWWLHQNLDALDRSLKKLGQRLVYRKGPALEVLRELLNGTGSGSAVYWNRRYEPTVIERDKKVKAALSRDGYHVESFNSALLYEPWEVKTGTGTPYKVFTPFWRTCVALPEPPEAFPAPKSLPPQVKGIESLTLDDLHFKPTLGWAATMEKVWTPGEGGAAARLERFLESHADRYATDRDLAGKGLHANNLLGASTSNMSAYLHVGAIGPRQVWLTTRRITQQAYSRMTKGPQGFLRELGWREFAYHVLYHFPHTPTRPLRDDMAAFPWRDDDKALRLWQRGKTGYPFVDAGMRQLWATGVMHNRVRMVVASFLVKHLLIHWRHGAEWFWDTLVDADLASNTLGWQWTAGCGADAAPYFRIFNPITQGTKFDAEGTYVRRWVPELARLPEEWIHRPWEAPNHVLDQAGVVLGKTYPKPIVDHPDARDRALEALAQSKR
ncbi:MAG: deoxyribodipyrimidine photo-lyase [Phycisphaera sp.]|nr:deoxyribodipyrimidine photo-lyase [Phycisphaera sp.]